jgi:L-serine dehydratase
MPYQAGIDSMKKNTSAKVSILNDVLGPVMRGPSSSHTAGSYRIARLVRSFLGGTPPSASLVFDPSGSYGRVYREQGVDLAFAAGFLGWEITDDRFPRALELAKGEGIALDFSLHPLSRADHPNFVQIIVKDPIRGDLLQVEAKSTGGGGVMVTRFGEWSVAVDGKCYVYHFEGEAQDSEGVEQAVSGRGGVRYTRRKHGSRVLIQVFSDRDLEEEFRSLAAGLPGGLEFRACPPVYHPTPGDPMFADDKAVAAHAEERRMSLGEFALDAEAALLGLSIDEVKRELWERYEVMRRATDEGMRDDLVDMQLLAPSAGRVFQAIRDSRVAIGGIHAEAGALALAAMHVCNSQGVVCAAPTGGAAGVLPGVLVSLAEKQDCTEETLIRGLGAAGAVGVIVAQRATFAAETAGCQVEIGAAGAMAAAAVVEMSGGTPSQAADAAAISFQNSMGSVCDLVQGMCEIPCHTRNAAAAAGAFVSADLILGGYRNPVPLDETIDAVMSCGKMLPPELRVTSLGGLALAPSALSLPRRR